MSGRKRASIKANKRDISITTDVSNINESRDNEMVDVTNASTENAESDAGRSLPDGYQRWRFWRYYKVILSLSNDNDDTFAAQFASLAATFARPLPTAFRVTGNTATSLAFLKAMQRKFGTSIAAAAARADDIPLPVPIDWIGSQLALRYSPSRFQLARYATLSSFHQWLVAASDAGCIIRQEEASMIPTHFMGTIEPHYHILDMCASPGSKTLQLLSALHGQDRLPTTASSSADTKSNRITTGDVLPTGCVVANDASYKRACLLAGHTRSLRSPALIVTNHDAQHFPLQLPFIPMDQKATATRPPHRLGFDRVLCDVPCSGDGTFRKLARTEMAAWSPIFAQRLHLTQIAICLRGLRLLRSGGRLVYSTCSLNPIENEGVMAAVLNQWNTAADAAGNDPERGLRVSLLDVSNEYPALKRRPGLLRWPIMALVPGSEDVMHAYQTWTDYVAKVGATVAAGTGNAKDGCIVESMFSPLRDEDGTSLGLQRCVRIWPHHGDTSGFFAAVLCKETVEQWKARTGHGSSKATATTKSASSSPIVDPHVLAKKERRRERSQFKIDDCLIRMPSSLPSWWNELCAVYGLNSTSLMKHAGVMVRHDQYSTMATGTGRVYVTTTAAADLLTAAHQSDTLSGHPHLKVVSSGVLIFEPPATRTATSIHIISNDGMRWLLPYLSLINGRVWQIDRPKLCELVASLRLAVWNIATPELQVALKLPSSQGRIILYCDNDNTNKSSSSLSSIPTLPYAVMCSNDAGQITVCANKYELWAIRSLLEA